MNIKFELKKELEVGQYLDVEITNKSISFVHNAEVLHTEKTECYARFKERKLKGVIIKKDKKRVEVKVIRFADLHRHSGFSLLDGASHIKDIVAKTDYVGALTDHGSMSGFLEYYKQMEKAGKQPIVGFEAYAETIDGKKKGNHLIILAKNQKGYKNLLKLTSKAHDNFYRKPHVSYEMLKEHKEGLIVTSACLGGEVPQALKMDYESAKVIANEYKSIFGDDFYLEIQRHNMGREEDEINEGLIKLSKETGIKLVATTDSHYTEREDNEVHEILLCIQTGSTLGNSPMRFSGDGYHIHSAEEMEAKFSDMTEALDNTLEIAEKCSGFDLELGDLYMPVFEIPEGYNEDEYFEKLVYEGFNDRFKGSDIINSTEYLDRLNYEINVIKQMKYSSYFLIVGDFIGYARDNGIMVGPGRGSAVGSLVSYCLGIIDLDPIPYGLLFERFLNPERVSMPDIDTDFCYERRGEVIEYIKNKYGEKSVSRIITHGTLAAKSVIRDVAKVMNFPYSIGAMISKAIPEDVGMTISKAIEVNPELADLYKTNNDVRDIIDNAKKLEGLPRHASVHACGLALSPSDASNFLPTTMMGKKGKKNEDIPKERTSQVTMSEVEDLGILKMDLLGLRTMTVIGRTIESINRCENLGLKYDDVSISDPYVYADISKANTYGVFQIEGAGMRTFMKELYEDVPHKINHIEAKYKLKGYRKITGKGDKEAYFKQMTKLGNELFERLIAGISLYRPGPMDYIPNYIRGMNDPENIVYDTPKLEPILTATYGTTVYQEQVMQIVQSLAGYSLGRADIVRRAMGKKKLDVMEQEKNYFINGKLDDKGNIEVAGCVRNGISAEIAEGIWHTMEDFSKYAFNKSHAAGYAVIAIKTAWLKHYYPVDFMSETLNSFIDKSDRVAMYLSVCKDMGIKILAPDVNSSSEKFARKDKDIIFGIKGIRNLGKTSPLLVEERETRGEFKSYQDVVERMMKHQNMNKKILEGLIYSGAMDNFKESRRAKVEFLPTLLKDGKRAKDEFDSGQISLLDINEELSSLKLIETPEVEEFEKRYKLDKEKDFAGFYITEHPLDEYSRYFEGENITEIGFLNPTEEDEDGVVIQTQSIDGMRIRIAGIVTELKTFYTKKTGDPLKVFKLEGKTGTIDCIMFSKQLDVFGHYLNEGQIVVIEGMVGDDDRGLQVIANEIVDIDTIKKAKRNPKLLAINIKNERDMGILQDNILKKKDYEGSIPLVIVRDGQKMKYNRGVKLSLKLISTLDNNFGENYKLVY